MGSAGYFVVIDGTRRNTLDIGMELQKMAANVAKQAPFIVLLNKSDLKSDWEVTQNDIDALINRGIKVIETSAKEGTGVEEAFFELTKMIID